MPRQRSAGRAPARPSVPARAASNPTHQQQTRPASHAAAPPPAAHPPAQAQAQAPSMGGGMLGNIASTAAGVAIGSTIGHAVTGLFSGGGSSNEPLPGDAQNNSLQANSASQSNPAWGNNCAGATQQFTKCMDDNGGNMQICGWYLEQLKACQAAASQY